MSIALREITIPDFGVPIQLPLIPDATYHIRCTHAYERAKCDWLVIYADREHAANMAFLSGFEPRFEEALLLLGPQGRRVLVVGNEGEGYAPVSQLPDCEVVLAQSLSLMGQDRSLKPNLMHVLRDVGMSGASNVGVVGWKYVEPAEWEGSSRAFFVPHFLIAVLNKLVDGPDALEEKTALLMHPTTGLRSTIDADQIALHEWGASRASAAVWRLVEASRADVSELKIASAMGYAGEVLTAHVMYSTGDARHPVVGMRSPGRRVIGQGDGVTAAIGYWGGLSARGGLVDHRNDDFLKIASGYFEGLISWYETADIGVPGRSIYENVTEVLARHGLRSALNPGHLTGHDEWINTPIRQTSAECIASGMPFQVDVIPTPLPTGWALNCEDGVVFADECLRTELLARHPQVYERIKARQSFVRDELGVAIRETILPLSSTPLCLPPFWLVANRLLARV
jgi:hypothetical protein